MEDIFEQATQIIMKEIQKELSDIVEEGSGRHQTIAELSNNTTIFGELISDIINNRIDAFKTNDILSRHKGEIFVEKNSRLIRARDIKADVILHIYSRDPEIDKKIRLLYYGGNDKDEDIIYHPNMGLMSGVDSRNIRIMESIQKRLTEQVNERINKMKIKLEAGK